MSLSDLPRPIRSKRKEFPRVFSDLGVIARSRHEIDLYQPWAAGMDEAFVDYKKDIQKDFAKKFTLFAELDSQFKNLAMAKVGAPTHSRFQYPSNKRRT